MKQVILLLVSLTIICCAQNNSKSKETIIDLGSFEITLPANFKKTRGTGIDSTINLITNGKISFDYNYSAYPIEWPLTKEEFIKKHSQDIDFKTTEKLLSLINHKDYTEKDGVLHVKELKNRIENLQIKKYTKEVKLNISSDVSPTYYYSMDIGKTHFNIPFYKYDEFSSQFEGYDIKIDTINNYKRKVSVWKNKKIEKYSSLYLSPLNINEDYLYIGTFSSDEMPPETIQQIFNSVKIKEIK